MPYNLLKFGFGRKFNEPRYFEDVQTPKKSYDVVIIGGGGHGLAAAYYLAKEHGITNVAVLERGYIGGGNTGRNTAIVRSNYLTPEGVKFYDASVKLFEDLSQELDLNLFYSNREPTAGLLMLFNFSITALIFSLMVALVATAS